MSREVKFRVWSKKKKCWLFTPRDYTPVMYFLFLNSYSSYPKILEYNSRQDVIPKDLIEEDLVLVEFIGQKDINGVDICEGDIIKYTVYRGFNTKPKEIIAPIIFRNGCFGFYEYKRDDDEYFNCYWGSETDNVEVIGNTFENPELLETKDD